ncbi:MAG: thioredoxin family protein [Planctomycetes bacterium]|nr:thioredoxin family protein [Planctomycetota bacterium]
MLTGLILAAAALFVPQDKVQALAEIRPVQGSETAVQVVVDLDIQAGWHVYHPDQDPALGEPTSLSIIGEGITATGEAVSQSAAKPHVEQIAGQIMIYQWLEGKPRLVLPAELSDVSAPLEVEVSIKYQVCDDRVCLPTTTHTVTAVWNPADPGEAMDSLPGQGDTSDEAEVSSAETQQGPSPADEIEGEKIKISGRFLSATAPQGGTVRLRIEATVEEGWHIYDPLMAEDVPGVPLAAKADAEDFVLSAPLEPQQDPIEHIEDFGFGPLTYLWVEGTGVFEADMKVAAAPGEYTVPVELKWMVCDESVCLDEGRDTLEIKLVVIEGDADGDAAILDDTERGAEEGGITGVAADEAVADQGGGIAGEGDSRGAININARKALNEGFWNLIWAAMLAGLATILTPCVFPMIPITVSFFTKRAEQGKGSALGNATAYTAGIIFTFVGLGIGMAAILGASGANQVASNAWVNLAIGALFVFLAFSLLGFFDIKPPKFLERFASKAQSEGQSKSGYAPVMLMAVAFSVTAFTCTVAFVGTVLGLAATGEWWYATVAMFAYALVFAMPFFFLALFPNMLQKMPSAGGWMNAVKVSFGYLELIAAWKFLSATDRQWQLEWLTRPVVIILTIIPLVLWAAYMFGLYMTKGDYGQRPPRTVGRASIGALALGAAIYLISGFPKGPYEHLWMEAYLPPEYYGRALTAEEEAIVATLQEGVSLGPLSVAWHEGYVSALAEGRKRNAPVFLDFTGITCVNCLKMEGNIFPNEEVAPLIKQMVRAHLYVDKDPYGQSNASFQEKHYQGASQPYYAVMNPYTEETLAVFEGYDPDSSAFAEVLQSGIEKGRAQGLETLPIPTLVSSGE